jgi:hypothetical protein
MIKRIIIAMNLDIVVLICNCKCSSYKKNWAKLTIIEVKNSVVEGTSERSIINEQNYNHIHQQAQF